MSLNPWHIIKGLWDRPVSIPANQGGHFDDGQFQAEIVESISLSATTGSALEATATALESDVSNVRLGNPFLGASVTPEAQAMLTYMIWKKMPAVMHVAHLSLPSPWIKTTLRAVVGTKNCDSDVEALDNDQEGANPSRRIGEHAREDVNHQTEDDLGDENSASHVREAHKHDSVKGRRKLTTSQQRDRQLRPAPSTSDRDYASEIIVENPTDNHVLPEGYLGTWRGFQFFSPLLHHYGSCGAEAGLHRLTCGHWIASSEPCGVNCSRSVYEIEAFVCDKCFDDVKDARDHRLSAAERTKLVRAEEGYHVFSVALALEFVTKHKATKANVTETVMSVLDGCGRASIPSRGPKEPESVPIEETIRGIQRLHERNEFEAKHPLVHHEKRSRVEVDQFAPKADEPGPATSHKHKKCKTCFDQYTSFTKESTYGSKRKAVDSDDSITPSRTKKIATAAENAFLQPSSKGVDSGTPKRDPENCEGQGTADNVKRIRLSNSAHEKEEDNGPS